MNTRSDSTELADAVPIVESECLLSVSVDSYFIDAALFVEVISLVCTSLKIGTTNMR